MDKKVLSIDVGGTSLKYTIFNNDGTMAFEPKAIPTRGVKKEKVVGFIGDLYREYKDEIRGIGISTPGAILESGFVNGFTGIDGWSYFHLFEELKAEGIEVPITALNDGNAAVYAEYASDKSVKNLATIAIGTGMGGGVIVNGELIVGKDGFGGELGYMSNIPILENDDNSLMSFISGSGSAGFMQLERRYEKLTGKQLTGKEIFDEFDKGEEVAKELIHQFYLGTAIIIWNIVFTLNLDVVYISGGITKRPTALKELNDKFRALLDHRNIRVKDIVEIKQAKYAHESGILGAYHYFVSKEGK